MRRLLMRLAPVLLLVACGNSSADPKQLLHDAASAMSGARSFAVDLKFGPGASLSGAILISATGRVKQNGDSATEAKVRQGDFVTQAELVSVGGTTFFRASSFLPFAELSPADAQQYPSTGRMLDPTHGVFAILPQGRAPRLDGSESVAGHNCYRLVAVYSSDQLAAVLTPIKPTGDLEVRLWIGQDDHLVRRLQLTGHLFDSRQNSNLDVNLHDFNSSIEISPPV